MSLTVGTGPFAPERGGRFNFDLPDRVIYAESWPRRLRAVFGGETVLDTHVAVALYETGQFMEHWIPLADVRLELLEMADGELANSWRVRVGNRVAPGEVRSYRPRPGDPDLVDNVNFSHVTMDRWFEEDDPIYAHLPDPYHRVDVRSSSRHVVIRAKGETVAETTRPKLLFETGLPTRFYLPFADVRLDVLRRSDTVSECPYKGDGQHWHLTVGGSEIEDAAWSLPHPLPAGLSAAEHLCFYPEKAQVFVDGLPISA